MAPFKTSFPIQRFNLNSAVSWIRFRKCLLMVLLLQNCDLHIIIVIVLQFLTNWNYYYYRLKEVSDVVMVKLVSVTYAQGV